MPEHGGNAAEQYRPRVFISYAHDDDAHIEQVETLYELLRKKGGLDAQLDLYAGGRPQDWAHWMERQCSDADYTLVIASPKYKLRAEHGERDGAGLGVAWESSLLRSRVYEGYQDWFEKILLVVLPGRSERELPTFFAAARMSRFLVPTLDPEGIEQLVRYMWGQPYRVPPELGPVPEYGTRPQLVSDSGEAPPVVHATSGATDAAVPDPDIPDGLDEAAWRQLADILRGVRPQSWAEQAYQWSFAAEGGPGRAAAAPHSTPAGDLYAWARDLGERRHTRGKVPKPVVFAHALAAGYGAGESRADRQLAGALERWVDRFLDSRAELPDAPAIKRDEATLTVRLSEHPQRRDRFYAQIWLRTTDGRKPRRLQPPENAGSLVVDMDGARDLFQKSMRTALLHVQLKRIEFAVFDDLLEEAFEQWPLQLLKEPRPIGKLYEVVVRCPAQRRHFDLPQLWSLRWNWLTRHSHPDEQATAWVADEDVEYLDDHIGKWRKNERLACVAVSTPLSQRGVGAALEAGMPIVVWQRDGHRGDPCVPPLNELLKLDKVADVSELPYAVAELRTSTDVPEAARASVVLLWDDPNHSPDADPLSDANLIP
ncbi:SEFIR domain-containing protein [Streptomyces sp. NPDC093591]|uniref:VMAP-C domain-containing protein n=1 Tax=Streptomyces sp. NPDC093591 TaxID=3366044 RepID=UPI00380D7BB0